MSAPDQAGTHWRGPSLARAKSFLPIVRRVVAALLPEEIKIQAPYRTSWQALYSLSLALAKVERCTFPKIPTHVYGAKGSVDHR